MPVGVALGDTSSRLQTAVIPALSPGFGAVPVFGVVIRVTSSTRIASLI